MRESWHDEGDRLPSADSQKPSRNKTIKRMMTMLGMVVSEEELE